MPAAVSPVFFRIRGDRRAIGVLIAVAVHLLLLLALLWLAPPPPAKRPTVRTFELSPIAAAKPPARQRRARAAARPRAAVPRAIPVPLPVVKAPAEDFVLGPFAGVDITKLPNRREELAGTGGGAGVADSGTASADAEGVGEGPGGVRLYNAEWQREPTSAELSFYIKRNAPPGSWAIIACRTVPRFRVEDCQEMAESPPGSGLARSIREAAWQFRVLPPRVNSRPQVGAWVQIRIDFRDADKR